MIFMDLILKNRLNGAKLKLNKMIILCQKFGLVFLVQFLCVRK